MGILLVRAPLIMSTLKTAQDGEAENTELKVLQRHLCGSDFQTFYAQGSPKDRAKFQGTPVFISVKNSLYII